MYGGVQEAIAGIFAFVSSTLPLIIVLFVLSRFTKAAKKQRGGGDPNVWLQKNTSQPSAWSGPGRASSGRGKLVKPLASSSSGEYRAPAAVEPAKASNKRSLGRSLGSSAKAEAASSLAETFMKDDRKNDWLARQMREEERILRRGDLMDLGASHASSCDAETLKRYHLFAEHDDSIDRGEY